MVWSVLSLLTAAGAVAMDTLNIATCVFVLKPAAHVTSISPSPKGSCWDAKLLVEVFCWIIVKVCFTCSVYSFLVPWPCHFLIKAHHSSTSHQRPKNSYLIHYLIFGGYTCSNVFIGTISGKKNLTCVCRNILVFRISAKPQSCIFQLFTKLQLS